MQTSRKSSSALIIYIIIWIGQNGSKKLCGKWLIIINKIEQKKLRIMKNSQYQNDSTHFLTLLINFISKTNKSNSNIIKIQYIFTYSTETGVI